MPPKHDFTPYSEANVLYAADNYAEAIPLYKAYLSDMQNLHLLSHYQACASLGHCLLQCKEYDGAVYYLNVAFRSLEADPRTSAAYYLGLCYDAQLNLILATRFYCVHIEEKISGRWRDQSLQASVQHAKQRVDFSVVRIVDRVLPVKDSLTSEGFFSIYHALRYCTDSTKTKGFDWLKQCDAKLLALNVLKDSLDLSGFMSYGGRLLGAELLESTATFFLPQDKILDLLKREFAESPSWSELAESYYEFVSQNPSEFQMLVGFLHRLFERSLDSFSVFQTVFDQLRKMRDTFREEFESGALDFEFAVSRKMNVYLYSALCVVKCPNLFDEHFFVEATAFHEKYRFDLRMVGTRWAAEIVRLSEAAVRLLDWARGQASVDFKAWREELASERYADVRSETPLFLILESIVAPEKNNQVAYSIF